ncbi:MAG: PAAR-like protein [Bacteroidota bacterium]
MPGFILHQGATILCAHGGQAQPTSPNPKVTVSGQPIVMQPSPHTVAGCPFNVSGAPSPCVTANWTTAATRVTSNGMPVLLLDSQAICAPNGTPLMITVTQTRVTAI